MEKTKKVTKRERFEQLKKIPAVAERPELIEFLDHQIELLDRKNASSANGEKKLTATQITNESYKETIVEILTNATAPMTVTDIIKAHPDLNELSNQKVSALVRQLVLADIATKTEDKRKTYFSIA